MAIPWRGILFTGRLQISWEAPAQGFFRIFRWNGLSLSDLWASLWRSGCRVVFGSGHHHVFSQLAVSSPGMPSELSVFTLTVLFVRH